RLKQYADTLKTPFFGALVDYQEEGNQLWTGPGHNGGVFYSRSPIGRIFVEHLGEAVFRDDLDNSILELGDLLTHEGPALQAQKEAAAIFGAEKTYFVLNGTSSSNKIVLTNLIAEDDLALFDRNNHKAAHQGALLMGGGIPIYLSTDRNAYGLIGPIRPEDLDETTIREAIRTNPLVKDPEAWKRERPFRAAVIEQCTYDGTIYDARHILAAIGPLCDYILFDEAWAGFMKFHPIYAGRFAIELRKKLRAVRQEFERREQDPARRWFFDPFVPDRVRLADAAQEGGVHEVPWESIATDALASNAKFWEFLPGAPWHGFTDVLPGFAITDPNKLTLLTPGFNRSTGEYETHGIPAPVVSQYLRENRVVPEKNDLNSLLFLLTPGVEASKAGTLVSALVAFKRLYDDNA